MKILFNCINNVIGGGVQNSVNFISFAVKDTDNDFIFLVSPTVNEVLEKLNIYDERIKVIENRKRLLNVQKMVRSIENQFQPDFVYTMAGPSFVKFKSKHVLGISDPYITHAKRYVYFLNKSFFSGLKLLLSEKVKGLIARFSADHFLFQTRSSLVGFDKRFVGTEQNSIVVANAIGLQFLEAITSYKGWRSEQGMMTILCPSAYYAHKNIEIVYKVAALLKASDITNIHFVLTIQPESFEMLNSSWPGLDDFISNIGPYSYSDALAIYQRADAVILPSLLETFSTVYIEAMALGLPLFVPKEDFAEDICEDYGIYYDSFSEASLFQALSTNETEEEIKQKQLIKERILKKYGNQAQRYKKIIDLFAKLLG